jgi:exodeoxyribonuclease-3
MVKKVNTTRLVSWNVNGIRAASRNGFWDWFHEYQPDMLFLQEVKALPEQLSPEMVTPEGYHSYWMPAERKGYSGVAAFVKDKPLSVKTMELPEFDSEGRLQILEFESFYVLNGYFPNSQEKGKRIAYKLDFCNALLEICEKLRKTGKGVVICGDYNIAHTEIDLKNPKTNTKNPGFLPEERAWMDAFIAAGYVDTFRMFHPEEPGHYSWWSYRHQAREKDIGWRIDYFSVNEEFQDQVAEAKILKDVHGSDHCPVTLNLSI